MSKAHHQESRTLLTKLTIPYKRYLDAARLLPIGLRKKASAPLLMSLLDGWKACPNRLLVVGQETNGWSSSPPLSGVKLSTLDHFCTSTRGIREMVDAYMTFDFARDYSHRNSAFWRAFRHLESNAAETQTLAMWTNLFRVDVNGSVVRNCDERTRSYLRQAQKGLLATEVKVLDPTVIVFFTGPTYDDEIRHEFPDSALEQLWPDRPAREVALVKSSRLPEHSFRIYHPNYLQRSRRWFLIDRLATHIRAHPPKTIS